MKYNYCISSIPLDMNAPIRKLVTREKKIERERERAREIVDFIVQMHCSN